MTENWCSKFSFSAKACGDLMIFVIITDTPTYQNNETSDDPVTNHQPVTIFHCAIMRLNVTRTAHLALCL